MTSNINLESRYQNRKGIYVLTYTNKPPYKIGMTNSAIAKRINSYVNCPSQVDGHHMHMLLTWELGQVPNAYNVEQYIFKRLEGRMNSTQRRLVDKTEHFDVSIDRIRTVFKEAQEYYSHYYKIPIYLDEPKGDVVYTKKKGKKNLTTTKPPPRRRRKK